MTRYEECLEHVLAYKRSLRCNPSAIENLIRGYVDQPGFDVTFREQLVRDAIMETT